VGADFVIVTAHSGAFCTAPDYTAGCNGDIVDVARRLTARPDLIVSGHTHSKVNTVVNGITIVQAFTGGTAFSIVDLDRVSPDSVAVRVVDQPTPYTDQVPADSAVAALLQRHVEAVGPRISEVVSFLEQPLTRTEGDYPLGNLIADAQRAATGTQVAIMNNGGIRVELLAGPLRYSDLFRLQPFANTLVTVQLTGDQLLRALEHGLASGSPDIHVSGVRVRYDPKAAAGNRVIEARLDDGTRVTPTGRYSVTVNNFMHEGGSGFTMLPEGADPVLTGIVDLDALVAYVRTLGQPARVPAGGRFVPVTAP
jgi:5'-nucleotidase